MGDDRGTRQKADFLEENLRDVGSKLNVDCLLDVLQALVMDCDGPALRRVKNIGTFFDRYHNETEKIKEWRTNEDDFAVIQDLGKGAFGVVQLVRHRPSQIVYAMKKLNKCEMIKRSESSCFWEERFILVNANSEWIVQLHYAFQDATYLYLAMDYMAGGDLASLIITYDFREEWVKFFCAEMILAIDVIHSMGFVHRDVKPDNMLLDASGHLKLTDFGLCMRMGQDGLVRCDMPVGTADYIPPEVLRAQEQEKGFGMYGRECDFWSIGICVYEMFYTDTPFFHENLTRTYANIMDHERSFHFPNDSSISPSKEARDLIRSFLCDGSVRLGRNGIADIKKHPFFRNDIWNFDNIRQTPAPIVPELQCDEDTSYFPQPEDERESSPKSKHETFIVSSVFQGNHLNFAGFTYARDNPLFGANHPRSLYLENENIGSSMNGRGTSVTDGRIEELLSENEGLSMNFAAARAELMRQQQRFENEIELRREAENQIKALIKRLEEEQSAKIQLAQNSHNHSDRLAFYERQLRDTRDKLLLETELVVKLKKANLEMTKNVTSIESDMRESKEKLRQLQTRCAAQEMDAVNLSSQLDQERQMSKEATERAIELQARYGELTEETDRLRGGFNDCNRLIKRLEEKLSEKEKQEAILELKVKNTQIRCESEISSLQREIALLNDENKQLLSSTEESSTVQTLKEKLQDETEQRLEALRQWQESETHLSVLQVDHRALQQQWSKLEADDIALNERIQNLTRELEEERLRRMQLQHDMSQLGNEVSRLGRLESKLQTEKHELEVAVAHFQQELSTLRAARDELQMQIVDLNENLETQSKFHVAYKSESSNLQEELDSKIQLIQELEEQKLREEDKSNERIQRLEDEKNKIIEERTALEKEKLQKEIEKSKMDLEIESLSKQVLEQKDKMKTLNEERKQLQNEIKDSSQISLINNNNRENSNKHDEQIQSLQLKLSKEKMLTQQAVNKLAEVMNKKSSAPATGKVAVTKSVEYRKKEKECRQLEQDLNTLKGRFHSLNIQLDKVVSEAAQNRAQDEERYRNIQQLLESREKDIEALKEQLETRSGLANPGSLNSLTDISDAVMISDVRKDGWLSLPNKQNIKRYGWKRHFVVVVNQKMHFYNSESDANGADAILTLEIGKMFHVRSVTHGDVIRANQDDIPKIFQILYAEEQEQSKEPDNLQSAVEFEGHQMVPITIYMPTSCDICQKQLWSMRRQSPALECRMCRVKVHKEHIDKGENNDSGMKPCKVRYLPSKDPVKEILLLAGSDQIQGDWVRFLTRLIQKGGYAARAKVKSLERSTTNKSRQ